MRATVGPHDNLGRVVCTCSWASWTKGSGAGAANFNRAHGSSEAEPEPPSRPGGPAPGGCDTAATRLAVQLGTPLAAGEGGCARLHCYSARQGDGGGAAGARDPLDVAKQAEVGGAGEVPTVLLRRCQGMKKRERGGGWGVGRLSQPQTAPVHPPALFSPRLGISGVHGAAMRQVRPTALACPHGSGS
jgi:hypothetical protein